jgi:ABC-type uncharacterized transport system ATPase subunit
MTEMDVLLRVENLNKRFPQVWANRDISLEVRRGEIHCLLGENGAGKTTLSECLYGAYRPDSGTITFKGQELELSSPRDAIRVGIGMVHQHFALAPPLTVVENIIVGTPLRFVVDVRGAEDRVRGICADYGVALDLRAPVAQLSVGQRQWVEILKALYVGVDLLILDEPTAVLTPLGTEKLFAVLQKMKKEGLSVIFITHKLDEVMAVSDRVTVLRKGELVATVDTASVDKAELARMMVGRDVVFRVERGESHPGAPLLEVEDLWAKGDRGQEALRGVSFFVRAGEVLGLAGVSGNGQKELFEILVGMRRASGGGVTLEGSDVTNRSPRYLMDRGIAAVPEDRIEEGLVMDFRLEENIVLGLHRRRPYARWLFIDGSRIEEFANESIKSYAIATPSARHVTRLLSGGNLQKVVLARELSRNPACLLANQPTRGLDVGATEYVHKRLLEQRDRGAAILLVSEDLDEIFNLSDRIAVIFKGQIAGVMDADEASLQRVALLMAGGGTGTVREPA